MTERQSIANPPARVVNKAGVAIFFGVSPQSVDAWIRRGLPAIERGTQGKPWRFDLLSVAEWRFSPSAGAATEGDSDPDRMAPKDRLDWYRGNREKMRHRLEAGELIEAETYRSELSSVLKIVAATLEDLPDRLEREAGLPGESVEVAIRVVDDLRERMYRAMIEDAEPKPPD